MLLAPLPMPAMVPGPLTPDSGETFSGSSPRDSSTSSCEIGEVLKEAEVVKAGGEDAEGICCLLPLRIAFTEKRTLDITFPLQFYQSTNDIRFNNNKKIPKI